MDDFIKQLKEAYSKSPKSIGLYFIKPNKEKFDELSLKFGSSSHLETMYLLLNDMSSIPTCSICNERNLSFNRPSSGYHKTCMAKECKDRKRLDSAKKTNLQKYGVEHHWANETVKKKGRSTMIERYGVDHNFKGALRDKALDAMELKHGVRAPLLVERAREKRRATLIDRYGTIDLLSLYRSDEYDNPMHDPAIVNKVVDGVIKVRDDRFIEKLSKDGFELVSFDRKRSRAIIKCTSCSNQFDIGRSVFSKRLKNDIHSCWKCHPGSAPMRGSKAENEIAEFIIEQGFAIERNGRKVVPGYEIDIYIPSLKLAIEFNGLYWHSDLYVDKNYHLKKTKEAEQLGISLFHIWEDSWNNNKESVKSAIAAKLGINKKTYARQCSIKPVENRQLKEFMELNHIDGHAGCKGGYGLFKDDVLMMALTYRKPRYSNEDIEIIRIASLSGHNIIGGFSKLISRLKQDHPGQSIISYRKKDLGNGGKAYESCGFTLIRSTQPNYWYIVDGARRNRMMFTKKKLVEAGYDPTLSETEIMDSLSILRIYDCGSEVWKFK